MAASLCAWPVPDLPRSHRAAGEGNGLLRGADSWRTQGSMRSPDPTPKDSDLRRGNRKMNLGTMWDGMESTSHAYSTKRTGRD